jgi:hypothetical protein
MILYFALNNTQRADLWVNNHFIAEANMLYLETPIGVGFSYSTNASLYEGVDDKITGMFPPSSWFFFFCLWSVMLEFYSHLTMP